MYTLSPVAVVRYYRLVDNESSMRMRVGMLVDQQQIVWRLSAVTGAFVLGVAGRDGSVPQTYRF
jgi:hypothetical protein